MKGIIASTPNTIDLVGLYEIALTHEGHCWNQHLDSPKPEAKARWEAAAKDVARIRRVLFGEQVVAAQQFEVRIVPVNGD